MKIRLAVAGVALALAGVAVGAAPAQADGYGPSNCSLLPPGSIISPLAQAQIIGNHDAFGLGLINPGASGDVLNPGQAAVPLFCNPHG